MLLGTSTLGAATAGICDGVVELRMDGLAYITQGSGGRLVSSPNSLTSDPGPQGWSAAIFFCNCRFKNNNNN